MRQGGGSATVPGRPHDHPNINFGKIGVLLVNLGTPEGIDYRSIRRYLAEFLSDRRVVEVPRWIWIPLLYGIILNTRPQRVGEAYRKVWNTDQNESFLRTYTRSQATKLAIRMSQHDQIRVDWAMRYGGPSIAEKLSLLKSDGCDRILLFPLYPQYSASTSATVVDKAFEMLGEMRWQPTLRIVPPYYDDPGYIDALAQSVRSHIGAVGWDPQVIVASFHGIPMRYFRNGDPYYCHCQKTARLLREALGWSEDRFEVAFQSRFGREEWLQPYADKKIEALARSGVKSMMVVTPGFVSDCLETLEEIEIQAGEIFRINGGEKFSFIPCLNDNEIGMSVLEAITRRELQGWL